jgi:hypothetical protein
MKKKVTLKDYRQFMKDQGLYYNSSDEEDYDNDSQTNGWSFKQGQYTFYLVDLTEPMKPTEIEPSIYEFTNGFDEFMEIYQRVENGEYAAKHPKNFEEFKTMLTESIKDLKAYINQIDLEKIKEDFK